MLRYNICSGPLVRRLDTGVNLPNPEAGGAAYRFGIPSYVDDAARRALDGVRSGPDPRVVIMPCSTLFVRGGGEAPRRQVQPQPPGQGRPQLARQLAYVRGLASSTPYSPRPAFATWTCCSASGTSNAYALSTIWHLTQVLPLPSRYAEELQKAVGNFVWGGRFSSVRAPQRPGQAGHRGWSGPRRRRRQEQGSLRLLAQD